MIAHNNWAENVEKEENLDFKTGWPIYYLMPTSEKVQSGASYNGGAQCKFKASYKVVRLARQQWGCPQQPENAVSL